MTLTLALVLLGLVLEDNDLLILVLRNHFRLDAYAVCGYADDNFIEGIQTQCLQIEGVAAFGLNRIDFSNLPFFCLVPLSVRGCL